MNKSLIRHALVSLIFVLGAIPSTKFLVPVLEQISNSFDNLWLQISLLGGSAFAVYKAFKFKRTEDGVFSLFGSIVRHLLVTSSVVFGIVPSTKFLVPLIEGLSANFDNIWSQIGTLALSLSTIWGAFKYGRNSTESAQ